MYKEGPLMELEEGGEHLAWGRKTPFHLPGSRGEGMVPCARVPVRKSWEFKEADKLASFKVSWGEGGWFPSRIEICRGHC